ncbi:MAG TPA: hypothetical protein VGZ71_13770, partial [Puia sp.]|nr:hypothetical protein [Puia sp.]
MAKIQAGEIGFYYYPYLCKKLGLPRKTQLRYKLKGIFYDRKNNKSYCFINFSFDRVFPEIIS